MRVIAGPEKKTRMLSEKERLITAYHEMGHAIVAHYLEGCDPVHKISVISRGQALGYTISMPTEDTYLTTRTQLRDTLAMTLGGRAAEELVYDERTTGAANDLEKVTATAKAMIMRFGMSETLGPRAFGRNHDQPFLGREFSQEPDYSEETSRTIDAEILRIVEEADQRAKTVLAAHADTLHRLSKILLDRETIDRAQFLRLLDGATQDEVFPPAPAAPAEPVAEPKQGEAQHPPGAAEPPERARRAARRRVASPGWRRSAERYARGALVGVVNVTPDSFSDGGRFLDAGAALAHGRRLAAEGAALVDVGGESTRPGAEPCSAGVELARVLPVVEGLAADGIAVSIDTSKAEVARAALAAGAVLVNDVTALRGDPGWRASSPRPGADLCLMHMLGEPRTMQDDPRYDDVVGEVEAFLAERAEAAVAAGIPRERIALDPGIGFGKTLEHNLALLRAPAAPGRARPADARRLAQALPRHAHRPGGRRRPRRRVGCGGALVLSRRRSSPARARRARHRRCARRRAGAGGCFMLTPPLTIEIRGLAIHAHHGVHEHERESGQRFLVDLVLIPRSGLACETDRLGDAVSYGDAARLAVKTATSTRFDLIERLAAHLGDVLLAQLPLERATVTVHKPDAPLGLAFEDVSVTVTRVRVLCSSSSKAQDWWQMARHTSAFAIGGIDRP